MLTHSRLSKISSVLNQGFFADNVLMVLGNKTQVRSVQKAILTEILQYIDTIESGKQQVSTLKLSDNAMESIDAYDRVLSIVVAMYQNDLEKGTVDMLTREIRKEVNDALQSKLIVPDKFHTTMRFFDHVSQSTLQESASKFGWERDPRPLPNGSL